MIKVYMLYPVIQTKQFYQIPVSLLIVNKLSKVQSYFCKFSLSLGYKVF